MPIPGIDPLGTIFGATGNPALARLATQARYLTEEDGREAPIQLDKIGCSQRLLAQIAEAATQRCRAVTKVGDVPMAQCNGLTADRLALAQAGEQLGQRLRLLYPIALHFGAGMQAMILLAVHSHHLHMRLERSDGRQETLAVVALGVELIRRLVGRGHQHHTLLHNQAEQATEQHGIADVADEQLVETQHAHFAPQLLGQQTQRIGIAGQLKLATMHPLHEVMKVLPPRRHTQAVVEAVHQPGLAAPDRPPEVYAERAFAAMHSLEATLQRLYRAALRGINDEAPCQCPFISRQRRIRQCRWRVQRSTNRLSSNCFGQLRRINAWPCTRTRNTSARLASKGGCLGSALSDIILPTCLLNVDPAGTGH